MSLLSEIKLLGAELEDGETRRVECPSCGESEGFTLTRDGNTLMWNCFRASCSLKPGRAGERKSLSRQGARTPQFTPYTGSLEPLSSTWREYLESLVGFGEIHFTLASPMYASEKHRIAYPIYGPMGARRGYVLRSYTPGEEPKALTRMDCAEPSISWYRKQDSFICVVVEDIPSAVRAAVAGDVNAVAMCGSGMSPDAVRELTTHGIRSVVWAFDEDATQEAIKHHNKYGTFFDNSSVLPLDQDLKDKGEEELCDVMGSLKID